MHFYKINGNSAHSRTKCWSLGDNNSDGCKYILMYQEAQTFPAVFTLGALEVKHYFTIIL